MILKEIVLLEQDTIDKIAAGEVIERPASVVKELTENAIDAGADAVTIEIRDGGLSLIRITDNGEGIDKSQIRSAFLRHATSKIRSVDDLLRLDSLGFRGEALSSISAVCQVELITKTPDDLTGIRYVIEGGQEKSWEEIGAPDGSTFLVRNIFYNTPARKKFLKSAVTEGGYVSDLVERLALSHPEISFQLIISGQMKLHTSGNGRLKDVIYQVFGRETTANLLPVEAQQDGLSVSGYIGKPSLSRGNRSFENYYVNQRYVKSSLITKAIEDGYHTFMMQHRFPFTVLMLTMDGRSLDINVHPTKMDVRFSDGSGIYQFLTETIRHTLSGRELILRASADTEAEQRKEREERLQAQRAQSHAFPEPFEKLRQNLVAESDSPYQPKYRDMAAERTIPVLQPEKKTAVQMELPEEKLLAPESLPRHRLIGQLFETYWLIQFNDSLYIIDQHAAHEKVMYERLLKRIRERSVTSQRVSPPLILTLSAKEEGILKEYASYFTAAGFEIEPFGGREYAVCAVPDDFLHISDQTLFTQMLDSLAEGTGTPDQNVLCDRLATMACKSAVKGNTRLSSAEADALIKELLTLENPYNCPHGRPTIISFSKQELERKFKRIV